MVLLSSECLAQYYALSLTRWHDQFQEYTTALSLCLNYLTIRGTSDLLTVKDVTMLRYVNGYDYFQLILKLSLIRKKYLERKIKIWIISRQRANMVVFLPFTSLTHLSQCKLVSNDKMMYYFGILNI